MKDHPYVGQIAAFIPGQVQGIPMEGPHLCCIITHVHSHEKVNAFVLSMYATPNSLDNIPYYRERPASMLGYSHAMPLDYDKAE